ncbi:MAG TPA: TatD family hydrolase [Patescibacteria group bacterium]|nr:TatD family hydrolase [Patescibacteria group bacterium]
MLFDTHAHLNFAAYKDDVGEVIKHTLKEGVFVANVGSQYTTSKRAVEIAQNYENGVWATVGLHPIHLVKRKINLDDSELLESEFQTAGEVFDYQKYLELAKDPKVVAIGEMGLDYHHFEEGDNISELKKQQKDTFLEGIRLANDVGKPLMIHCWDAYDDLLEILKSNLVEKRGVIHSFIGGYKTARKFIELGYKIGMNGVMTYTTDFNRLIKEVALEDIVLETDCPYLTPIPHKGERNEPIYVKYVAEKVAEVKGISCEEVEKQTTENALRFFKLSAVFVLK